MYCIKVLVDMIPKNELSLGMASVTLLMVQWLMVDKTVNDYAGASVLTESMEGWVGRASC